MKLSIDRSALLRSLSHVQSVVERRNTIPILSNVLIKAEDGVLSLSSTDMDLEINESVAATVLQDRRPVDVLHHEVGQAGLGDITMQ